jgi:hypothetical protein
MRIKLSLQIINLQKVQELYHALGTLSIKNFKAILRMNIIANNPVTIDNIEIAKQIFGSDVGSLKGKITKQKLILVVDDYIAIPEELYAKQQDIVLCIDSIKVDGMLFLTAVSKHIFYQTAQYVKSKSIS